MTAEVLVSYKVIDKRYGLCVLVCCTSHADVCSVIPIQIGNYRARDHFHQLVPQQELEQRVKKAEETESRDLAKYFHALVDMMKKVFVEEHVRRPTAQDLLCEDVMLKGTHTHRMHTRTQPVHVHQRTSTPHALTRTHLMRAHTHRHHCAQIHHQHVPKERLSCCSSKYGTSYKKINVLHPLYRHRYERCVGHIV